MEALRSTENAWFYDKAPQFNRFATKGSDFEKVDITKNPMVCIHLAKTDVTANAIELRMDGYQFDNSDALLKSAGALNAPQASLKDAEGANKAFTITAAWDKQANAD